MINNYPSTSLNFKQIITLHTAATLKTLIENQPFLIEQKDDQHQTLLYCAYWLGHYDKVMVLLKAGARDTPITTTRRYQTKTKGFIGTYTFPNQYIIHSIIEKSQIDLLKLLLQNDSTLLEQRNSSGNTPLLLAIQYHFLPGIKYLISIEANVNTAITAPFGSVTEKTALHLAYTPGRYETIKLLLQAGAIDTACNGEFVLHKLVRDGQLELVQLLLEKQPWLLNQRNKKNDTPVMLAYEAGWNDLIEYLKAQGAEMTEQDTGKLTSKEKIDLSTKKINLCTDYLHPDEIDIHTAAKHGFHEQIQWLLTSNPALLNQPDGDSGLTPLMLAARNGKITTVEYLIAQKNIELNLKSEGLSQETALGFACLNSHELVALALLKAGAQPDDLATEKGQKQLYLAAKGGCIEVVERLLHQCFEQTNLDLQEKKRILFTAMSHLLDTEPLLDRSTGRLKTLAIQNNYTYLGAYLNRNNPNQLFLPSVPIINGIRVRHTQQAAANKSNGSALASDKHATVPEHRRAAYSNSIKGTIFNPSCNNQSTNNETNNQNNLCTV